MDIFSGFWLILMAYLIGSIPFGLIIVKLSTGKDIRSVESGRTGGTNALRAAGMWAGLITGILDVLKGAGVVWLTKWLMVDKAVWIEILVAVTTIVGHNHSIYMPERDEKGRWRLRGGAGGAPCLGGAMGLWMPSGLFILPLGLVVWYFVGYASLATLSIPLTSIIIFSIRAWKIGSPSAPWEYIFYGGLSLIALVWALRPNINRLIHGNERIVGFRVRKKRQRKDQSASSSSSSQ